MTKITLATLPNATAQEVFDQVAKHLLTQNKQSLHPDNKNFCQYRGADDTMCAAGCLIGDSEYVPAMDDVHAEDGTGWGELIKSGLVPDNHFNLIRNLQMIHDSQMVCVWKEELQALAERENLQFNF